MVAESVEEGAVADAVGGVAEEGGGVDHAHQHQEPHRTEETLHLIPGTHISNETKREGAKKNRPQERYRRESKHDQGRLRDVQ